jgi:hypothetical protein
MLRIRVLLPFLVLVVVVLAGCGARPNATPTLIPPEVIMAPSGTPFPPGPARGAPAAATPTPTPGLGLRLGEGQEQVAAVTPAPTVPAQPLTGAEVGQVLNRLPTLQPQTGDQQDFAVRAGSLPAPRPGQTITQTFPPPTSATPPAAVESGPLEVLRYQPDGEVPLAPYLSVTFNQPMVALTSLGDLANETVPVKLSPIPAGKWRWVGTKTLMFEPSGRFPMATKYTVEIPAGTKSATGGVLARAVTWTFTTPPPTLQSSYPNGGPTRRDVLMFAAFDQRIAPAAVLATTKVAAGGSAIKVRLATSEEVQADKTVRSLADRAGEGRWLAFKSDALLPGDSSIMVTIGPGTPSAEGPLTTAKAQAFNFRTYGPLVARGARCGYSNQCPPFTPWYIEFNNPLDDIAFDPAWVTVSPELPSAVISAHGNVISVQGRSQGRTSYRVTVSAALLDQFGQNLGRDNVFTIQVGSAYPSVSAPGGGFVVLDPTSKSPTYSIYSINYERLKVTAYRVTPDDWQAFKTYQREFNRTDRPPSPPGRQAFSRTISINAKADEMAETAIDLSEALQSGLGHVVVVIEPDAGRYASLLNGRKPPKLNAWVQVTRIGLDAFADADNLVAWANRLTDGAPLNGVELSLAPGGAAAVKTNDAGMATLALSFSNAASILIGRLGNDVAMLPQNTYYWGDGGWLRRTQSDSLRWYVFDDRGMYRPGEEVHIKGWIRLIGAGTRGDVMSLGVTSASVSYRLRDARGNEIRQGTAPVNALGGFTTAFTLTDTMNLGAASLELTMNGGPSAGGNKYTHRLQVQEFRRPEFEVKASASEGPHFVGGNATASVAATYYAGGGLPNAEVTWRVSQSKGSYSPPGWSDFTFGTWVPWWGGILRTAVGPSMFGGPEVPAQVDTYTGHTDAAGVHLLRVDFPGSVVPPQPLVVRAEASVMDVNRQAWNSSASMLVHPAELYVGIHSDRTFVQREQPLKIETVVTDLDGKPVPGVKVTMRAARMVWRYQGGAWKEVEDTVQPCTVTSGTEPVTCTFETPEGGTYRITATVADAQGRPNQAQFDRWVSGGQRPPARQVEQEEVTLIPDKETYHPGETAEILVQAPFFPAEGLVTLRRSGMVTTERFAMTGPSYTLKVPIQSAYIPNLWVQVDLVGAAARTNDAGQAQSELPKRPAFAMGQLNLSVPPLERALKLDVAPRETKLEPGGTTTVDVTVKDAQGKPVQGAELAVVVVDEAVLALSNYDMADPLAIFYSQRDEGVADTHLRSSIILANPDDLAQQAEVQEAAADTMRSAGAMPAPAAPAAMATMAPAFAAKSAAGEAEQAAPIAMRTDFNPLASFAPAVPTDAQGKAQVAVKVPDNLTRYRVMVVAVAGGKQFGEGESAITARLPLMVRPSPPRFLNFGDKFELSVVVQNQTDAAMAVDVAVRATNLGLAGSAPLNNALAGLQTEPVAGKRVQVPANDRVEVRFGATTVSAGTARVQIAAASGQWADASSFELPVWTPATTEAFAVYGVLDQGAIAQPVIAPSEVFTQFGGLEITTSSTALQALTDAVLYLVAYPFECSEQLASRILAVAALRDVLTAFKADGLPPPDQINAAVARDIERLGGMQNGDGGWPVWKRGDETWPYHSIHVAHALARAKAKGYDVPSEMTRKAVDYLRNIESRYPAWYPAEVRRTLTAYALNVRKQLGDADPARARRLIQEAGGLEKLGFEAVGWIYPILSDDAGSKTEVDEIRRLLNNRVTETAGAAHFTTSYGDNAYLLLHSNRRVDGILLESLIIDQPQSDLIPKLVTGLLAHRKAGRWANTQENAFILLALDRYFNTYEAQTPDFVARMWLGDTYVGEAAFRGRTTDYKQVNVPMAYLAANVPGTSQVPGTSTLILDKEGPGRLYYRLGMRYAPRDLRLPAYEAGFTVQRSYEAVDNPADVSRDADGVWHVKAGARVRVRLTMVAPARRYHVALIDPLPAGFEALNPALAVTGSIPKDPAQQQSNRYWWWRGTWYEHQNLRDERVEAFASLLWEGVHTYTYVARATNYGTFVAPPAKAEEMYMPETFGRSAVDIVIVE